MSSSSSTSLAGRLCSRCRQRLSQRPMMSPRERLALNPFEKWKRYGRFPWKLSVHCLMAVMTTALVYLTAGNSTLHARHSLWYFSSFLVGLKDDSPEVFIHSEEHLVKQINRTLDRYWKVNESALTHYEPVGVFGRSDSEYGGCLTSMPSRPTIVDNGLHHKELPLVVPYCSDTDEPRIILDVVWHKGHPVATSRVILGREWRNSPQLADVLGNITHFASLQIRGRILDSFRGPYWHQCFDWGIASAFYHGGSGQAAQTLNYELRECAGQEDGLLWLPLSCFFVAVWSMALQIRAKLRWRRLHFGGLATPRPGEIERHPYLRLMPSASWAELWLWFTVLANVVQALASLACMRGRHAASARSFLFPFFESAFRSKAEEVTVFPGETIEVRPPGVDESARLNIVGLSAFLAWVGVLRYLQYFSTYYVVVRTLSRALPRTIRFLAGVAPILLGYSLMGMCTFWPTRLFSSLTQALMALFSLLNGDMIHDVFMAITQVSYGWGQVYVYSFMILFVYVVLNIFLAIVEEAFFAAKDFEQEVIDSPRDAGGLHVHETLTLTALDQYNLDPVAFHDDPPLPEEIDERMAPQLPAAQSAPAPHPPKPTHTSNPPPPPPDLERGPSRSQSIDDAASRQGRAVTALLSLLEESALGPAERRLAVLKDVRTRLHVTEMRVTEELRREPALG